MDDKPQDKFTKRELVITSLMMISVWLALLPPIVLGVVEVLDHMETAVGKSAMAYFDQHGLVTFVWSWIIYILAWPFIFAGIGSQMSGSVFSELKGLPLRKLAWKILKGLLVILGAMFFVLLTINAGKFNQ